MSAKVQTIELEMEAAGGWPKPLPLVELAAPQPYPLDALPDGVRQAVEEVRGFVQAPVPLVAASALTALSLAAQAHVDVRRDGRLEGPVSLFMLTIADSGERKSTCDGFFIQPVREYEQAEAEAAKPGLANHRAVHEAWKAKRDGIKDKIRQLAKEGKGTEAKEADLRALEQQEPQAARVPRLLYADSTPEALAYRLAHEWPSGGLVSAEAGNVLGGHAMSSDSMMRNLALLNTVWEGGSHRVDRRTSESFIMRGVRLTVGLQVQEATLREFLERSGELARGTGFLARFLMSWPQSTQGQRLFTQAPTSWPHLEAFHRKIGQLLREPAPIGDDGALTPTTLVLSPEAAVAWVEFHDDIERELGVGGELRDVRDVASKIADNAVRLAALFHVYRVGAAGAIGQTDFDAASAIVTWHLHESRRFFGELAMPEEQVDAVRLDDWLVERCRRGRMPHVARREAQQFGPVRKGERLKAALLVLAELGRVREVQAGQQKLIWVHPALVQPL